MKASKLLLITGMHRSGTSALCAALSARGVSFGNDLLDPMAGVNDEGFWEDAGAVTINDRLLALWGGNWYAPPAPPADGGLDQAGVDELLGEARQLLQRGFGEGEFQAVKDPRFCLTLPFWLRASQELGIDLQCCVIGRAPLEVAHSLQKRDGLPLGYGLRLYLHYRRQLASHLPSGSTWVDFSRLLAVPGQVMEGLGELLGLPPAQEGEDSGLRPDLRHHADVAGLPSLSGADLAENDLDAIERDIDAHYPLEQTLAEFARSLVERGCQLTSVGEQHTLALATLGTRDAEIAGLAAEHEGALATIAERDGQIRELDARLAEAGGHLTQALATLEERDTQIAEFDARLTRLGEEHDYALGVIRERDTQIDDLAAEYHAMEDRVRMMEQRLERLWSKPVIGRVFARMWVNEED